MSLAKLWTAAGATPPIGKILDVRTQPGTQNRGLYATKRIYAGDELLRVPLSSIVSVPRGPDDDAALATALGRATVERPLWVDYRRSVLPKTTNAAMLWKEAEIRELQHPPAVALALDLRRRRDRFRASAPDWAWSMVYSRSFSLELDGGYKSRRMRACVPIMDLANHLPESPAAYARACGDGDEPLAPISADDDSVVLRAPHDAAEGAEILVPYGLESNAELLVQHGFELGADNDAEYVSLADDLDDFVRRAAPLAGLDGAAAAERLARLRELDAAEAPLAARGDLAASGHVLGCARYLCEPDGMREDFAAAVGHHTLVGAPAPAADGRARALVSELALEALRAFPTTTVEDEAVLASATDKRTSAAVAYRLGVKRRLQTFVGQLRFREYNF